MHKRDNFFLTFLIFLSFSILFIFLTGIFGEVRSSLEQLVAPVAKFTYGSIGSILSLPQDPKLKELEETNRQLNQKLSEKKNLELEVAALRDQFQTTNPRSFDLMPAKILGSPQFIPGVSKPSQFILDKGQKDGIKVGQAVVFQNYLVGKITSVSKRLAKVSLITSSDFSFTAQTKPEGGSVALGVVAGTGDGEMIFDKVLLSETIKASDTIVTKGDLDVSGLGLPADLLIGEIISVDKKTSSLFQSARIKSFLDFSKLSFVFVLMQ